MSATVGTAEPAGPEDMVVDKGFMSLGKRQPIMSHREEPEERNLSLPKRIKLRLDTATKKDDPRVPCVSAAGNLVISGPQHVNHRTATTLRSNNNNVTIILKNKSSNSSTILVPPPHTTTGVAAPPPGNQQMKETKGTESLSTTTTTTIKVEAVKLSAPASVPPPALPPPTNQKEEKPTGPVTIVTTTTTTTTPSSTTLPPAPPAEVSEVPSNLPAPITPEVSKDNKATSEAPASPRFERQRLGYRPPCDPTPLLVYKPSPRILPANIPALDPPSDDTPSPTNAPQDVAPISQETARISRTKISPEEDRIVSHLERHITSAGTGTESARGLAQLLRFSVLAEKVMTEAATSKEVATSQQQQQQQQEGYQDQPTEEAVVRNSPSEEVTINSLMQEWCSQNTCMLNDLGAFEDIAVMGPEDTYLDRPPVSFFSDLSVEDNQFLSEYDRIRLVRTFLGFVTSRLEIIRDMCPNQSIEEALVTRTYSFWVQRLREYV